MTRSSGGTSVLWGQSRDADVRWRRPPAELVVSDDEVHVWRAELRPTADSISRLESTLTAGERARAARFRFAQHRRRFVARRGILRAILARYVDVVPEDIDFAVGRYGKPALAGPGGGESIRFNLSHAGDWALVAVARDRNVGVDLEWIDRRVEVHALASRVFAPRGLAVFRRLPPAGQTAAFFAGWTRTEAYLKAHGIGMSAPPALWRALDGPEAVARWSIYELDAGAGFAAALAVEGRPRRLGCWQWERAA